MSRGRPIGGWPKDAEAMSGHLAELFELVAAVRAFETATTRMLNPHRDVDEHMERTCAAELKSAIERVHAAAKKLVMT